jgi:pimeloyl-ACP methyl ester carboxylesterase
MASRSLFASLVGINAYRQGPLNGCIRDVLAMDMLLRDLSREQGDQALHYEPKYFLAPNESDKSRISTYTREQKIKNLPLITPSFKNISSQAFEHFKSAKDGDVCVFFYSGHGSQTEAPPEFWQLKPTRQNETIVCLDSRDTSKPEARDLVDKEIAYLLWDALSDKKVHMLVVMDCCHSGNNTRGELETVSYRYLAPSKTKIPFEKYLGYGQGNFYETKVGNTSIKIARYVHLAAAMDAEKAQETNDGGLFTTKLLQVLRAGGTASSYRELMKTVSTTVRTRNPQQNPVAFALHDEDLDLQFLGKGLLPLSGTFEVRYFNDRTTPQWRMYGGALHGITVSEGATTSTVVINATGKEVNIVEVAPFYSVLDDDAMSAYDKNDESLKATVARLASKPILIGIGEALQRDEKLLGNLLQAYKQKRFAHIQLDNGKGTGQYDYVIRSIPNEAAYILTTGGNDRPLFKRQHDPGAFLDNCEKAGKWINVSNLSNTNSRLTASNFRFEVEKLEGSDTPDADGTQWTKLTVAPGDEIVCNYAAGKRPIIRFSMAIAPNSSLDSVFVGALYLDCRYGISYNLVRTDESELKKRDGTRISLKTEEEGQLYDSIILELDPKFKQYNINEITDSIKVFIATKPMNLDSFRQDNLELDEKPADRSVTRGMGSRKENNAVAGEDWTVFNFSLRIIGPDKLKTVSEGKATDFAAFSMTGPRHFSASVFAATSNDIRMKKPAGGSRAMDSSYLDALIDPSIWGDAAFIDTNFMKEGLSANNDIVALEFLSTNETGNYHLADGEEIVLQTNDDRKATPAATRSLYTTRSGPTPAASNGKTGDIGEDKTIIPYGFDESSGLFFPVGYMDDAGKIHVKTLPAPSPGLLYDQQPASRSLGSSVKLFFRKLVRKKKINSLVLYIHDKKDGWQPLTDEPKKMKEFLEIKPEGNAILLIHGITGDSKFMVESIKEIKDLPGKADFIMTYDYENLSTPIPSIAQQLGAELEMAGFTNETMPSLTIVAHSMGGLVSRWLVEKSDYASRIAARQLILVGTPGGGSEIALAGKAALGMLTHALNVTGPIKYIITGLAFLLKKLELDPLKTLGELKPGSTTLQQLAVSEAAKGTGYYIVGGDTSLLKRGYHGDDFFLKKLSAAMMNNIIYPGLTFSLFKEEANDMAVTVKSMMTLPRGEDAHSTKIIACNHCGYFMDSECRNTILQSLDTPVEHH